jgi:deoxyribodipyrimidine photo-lyase
MSTLVWIRGKDLRLHDHPALSSAGRDSLCIFVIDPYFFSQERAKSMPHRMQFLLDSLRALSERMERMGGKLWTVPGRSCDVVPAVARAAGVTRVLALRWTEPFGRTRDKRVADALDVPLTLLEGETLLPPGMLRTQGGKPYSVFSPFARSFRRTYTPGKLFAVPTELPSSGLPDGIEPCPIPTLKELGLDRNPLVLEGGEQAAHCRLTTFLHGAASRYTDGRNRMDTAGTSRISADIKFGIISPRTAWIRTMKSQLNDEQKDCFCNELIWREFNHSTLWDNPHILGEPFKPQWAGFPWSKREDHWTAWTTGTTGYPIVDAAARQLLATGFVHNRARMIAASFLTKHLLLDYRQGEAHYLRWLTDGDWAQNNMGWQWAAGSGADAQPWFRIFNPMTQGKKFDPTGHYVRTWVPELAGLEDRYIHAPWEAPPMALHWAGIKLGQEYPNPIVDHKTARQRFLETAKSHLQPQTITFAEETSATSVGGSGDESPTTLRPA